MAVALTLRRVRTDDAPAIAAIYAPYVRDTVISFETEPPTAEVMAGRIAAILDAGLPYIAALGPDGAILGYAYAGRFHPRHAYRYTIEPTVYLAGEARGGGIGTQLYAALFAILEELGYRQAVALVTLPNPASVALHVRHGFRHSGTHEEVGRKFGEWIDVGLFQRAIGKGADDAPNGEPLALEGSAVWRGLD
ncbi:MAG: N-acetyltransferase family protein [Sphingobium sp.]